jgi:mevalonate kinase
MKCSHAASWASPILHPTSFTVPGKLILMGEHAVVYGRPALAAAAGLHARVRVAPSTTPGVTLDLPGIGVRERLPWGDVRDYACRARAAWCDFADRPGPAAFDRLRGSEPDHLVRVALGQAAELCGEPFEPIIVSVDSDIPVGAGLGSSAALAVAIVSAYLGARGRSVEPDAVDRAALEVERCQHGFPSGLDHATVLRGGVVWAECLGPGLTLAPLGAGGRLLARFRVFHTGQPPEATGAVVAAVRAERDADLASFDRRLDDMEACTRALRACLDRDDPEDREAVEAIRAYEHCLEAIGVVPPGVAERIRRIEAAGGAAKISGAGSLAGPGAGCLLVFHPDPLAVDGGALSDWPSLPFALGVPGLRRDSEPS